MIFKADWEKTNTRFDLAPDAMQKMIGIAYPNPDLDSVQVIAGGCANLNVKFSLKNHHAPLIMRVYLRDPDAAWREQSIAKLLAPDVPVPQILYIGEYENYTYAIAEFMPGITLRDLLLSKQQYSLSKIMYKVGVVLSTLSKHKFSEAGFFDKNLHIAKKSPNDGFLEFINGCLKKDVILGQLDPAMVAKIKLCIDKYADLFPTNQERCLVHADFDPANILVAQQDGDWEITGVLDWEFAFSGSMLCDVANMLRYAHQMPTDYADGFLNGLKDNGVVLPANWKITVDLLNLLSLLDCLDKADQQNRPKQRADIIDLITHILERLD